MGLIPNKDITGEIEYNSSLTNEKWEKILGLSTLKILEKGIAYIPEDRSTQGIINEFQVNENSWLGYLTQPIRARVYIGETSPEKIQEGKLILKRKYKYYLPYSLMNKFSNKIKTDLDVATPSVKTLIKNLSGGNQQKVILGREFAKNPRLIIASQPTRGVDIGVTEKVRNALIDMRNVAAGIFLISSDLDEVLSLSDYILVMYEGKIVGRGPINEFTIERLSKLMTTGRE